MYYLYVLTAGDIKDFYYVGMTNSPKKRFIEHLNHRWKTIFYKNKIKNTSATRPTKTNQFIVDEKEVRMIIIDKSEDESYIVKKEADIIRNHYAHITNVYDGYDSCGGRCPGKNNFETMESLSSKDYEFDFYIHKPRNKGKGFISYRKLEEV